MRIAILGAGKVGTAIARTALRADHQVDIATSGSAEDIRLLIEVVAPGAVSSTAAVAVPAADITILAIPAPKFRTLDPVMLSGRIVVDAMNYWPDTDGTSASFTQTDLTSSEVVARHLPAARVVKTLNHIGYHELESDIRPRGAQDRRALAVVSDDRDAAATVARFIDSIGYDPVSASPLRRGGLLEPGTPIFAGALSETEMQTALGATRTTSVSYHPVQI